MTAKDMYMKDHPHTDPDSCYSLCPSECGYPEDASRCEEGCAKCWNREIPGTIKKENKTMANSKMTKAELLKEIEAANEHIYKMEEQLKNLEKYKQYEEAADELKAMHTALMNSGFTNEQAFDLLKTTMQSMMPTILRGMRL